MKTALLLLALLTMFLLEMDIVRNHYDSRDELMADGGGWLPDFLPGSARDIRTVVDVDLDTSAGGFEFSDTDAGLFFARLTLGPPQDSPFEHWDETVRDYRASGYVAWSYQDGRRAWTFFCHPARDECDYRSW